VFLTSAYVVLYGVRTVCPWTVCSLWSRLQPCIVPLKRGGTSLREKAGFKGRQANGVGTQLMKRDRQVTACTALLPCYYYDVYTSPASSWLSWQPRRFEWTVPFLWKTKYSFCGCAITFKTHSPVLGSKKIVSDISKYGVLCEVRTVCPFPLGTITFHFYLLDHYRSLIKLE
jgi:hypothetical protein